MNLLLFQKKRLSKGISLALDFTSGVLDSRITFTRASSGTRVNSSGVIESVASNLPRFDYDPATLAPKGLLIEEQRTNLLTYSEDFGNVIWIKTRASVTTNATVSPDGTLSADKLVEDTTASNSHYLLQPSAVTSGSTYSVSVYAKAGERQFIQIVTANVNMGLTGICCADLVNGTVQSNANYISAEIKPVNNGWFRVTAVMVPSTTGLNPQIRLSATNTLSLASYSGDGVSGVYLWGAQTELGAFPTSYIPTTSATVTRAADNASMVGTNFSSWYNQSEGAFVTSSIGSSASGLIVSANKGTTAERVQVSYGSSSGGNINLTVTDGGVLQAQPLIGSITPTNLNKIAATYKLDDFALSVNGITPAVDTLGNIPTPDRLTIGMSGAGVIQINGWIQSIKYYPRRLANGDLQRLTR